MSYPMNYDDNDFESTQSSPRRGERLQCSFCKNNYSSSAELREHLMQCGNKTDRCPNCRRFIRRAIFAYHYENDCANLEETEPPAEQQTNQLKKKKHRTGEYDIDDYDEGEPSHRSAIHDSRDQVMIPCEFCSKSVSAEEWSIHLQDCREREDRRLKAKAKKINKTPITERIPCEYCKQLLEVTHFRSHEKSCPKNPENSRDEVSLHGNGSPASRVTFNPDQTIDDERSASVTPRSARRSARRHVSTEGSRSKNTSTKTNNCNAVNASTVRIGSHDSDVNEKSDAKLQLTQRRAARRGYMIHNGERDLLLASSPSQNNQNQPLRANRNNHSDDIESESNAIDEPDLSESASRTPRRALPPVPSHSGARPFSAKKNSRGSTQSTGATTSSLSKPLNQ